MNISYMEFKFPPSLSIISVTLTQEPVLHFSRSAHYHSGESSYNEGVTGLDVCVSEEVKEVIL